MKRRHISVLSGVAVAAVALSMAPAQAQAIPAQGDKEPKAANREHDLPNPLGERALRKEAVEKLIKGEGTTARGGQRVIKLAGTKTAEAAQDRYVSVSEESIFTILSEFSDMAHNEIPAPTDRAMDNSTYWTDDFNQGHYKDMMFGEGESFKDFYLKQSNGRFLAKGDVSDWVTVPYKAATYGDNANSARATGTTSPTRSTPGTTRSSRRARPPRSTRTSRSSTRSTATTPTATATSTSPTATSTTSRPSTPARARRPAAVSSARTPSGRTGGTSTPPTSARPARVRTSSAVSRSVARTSGSATTPPSRRTAASACSRTSSATTSACRTSTTPRVATTDRLLDADVRWLVAQRRWQLHRHQARLHGPVGEAQLGWLDYKVVNHGTDSRSSSARRQGQDQLPGCRGQPAGQDGEDRLQHPALGLVSEWWGGAADDLQNTLTRSVDLTGKTSASMSAWLEHEIEEDYDYLYVESPRTARTGPRSTRSTARAPGPSPGPQRLRRQEGRRPLPLRHRRRPALQGPFLDDLAITADGAPSSRRRRGRRQRLDGRRLHPDERLHHRGRQPLLPGREPGLQRLRRHAKTGPYNFGFANTRPDWVERFPYQNLLLVHRRRVHRQQHLRVHPGGGRPCRSTPARRR